MKDWKNSLPTLPSEEDGHQRQWVILAAEGPLEMPSKPDEEGVKLNVTPEWINDRIKDYQSMTEGTYTSPVLIEHQAKGLRPGAISKLETWTDPRDDRQKLLGQVKWAKGIDARKATESGELCFASPRWGRIKDELGVVREFALREASMVSAPYQKHMATSHFLAEGGAPTEDEEPKMEDEEKKKEV